MEGLDKRAPFTAAGGIIPPEFRNIKTPCYILDEKALIKNAKLLGKVAKETGCKMLLAQKAFSNYDCYRFFEPYLAGTEASGLFKWLGTGYKKIWTEYSGIVELGIDVNRVSVSKPDSRGVVKIAIPDAEILNVDLDEASMGEPLTDTGFFTKITKEEETAALAEAQKNMEETARSNSALLAQAKERAKNVIEGYVKNVGEQLGEKYTVEWTEAPAGASESAGAEDKGL